MKPVSAATSVVCLAFALVALVFAPALPAQQGTAMPVVSDAWVKTTVPGGEVSAAYMHIKSAIPLKLVKAESLVAGSAEIHDMKMHDGVMEMRALDALVLAPGKVVELKPGAIHVMLMKVKKPINKGDKVPLVLTFEGAMKQPLMVTVDAIAR